MNISEVLKRGSTHQDHVKALQTTLFELGFSRELNWDKYGADGQFGNSTVAAIKAFAAKNKLPSDGESVSLELMSAMVEKLEIARSLRVLHQLVQNHQPGASLPVDPSQKNGIAALQKVLQRLDPGFQRIQDPEGDLGTHTLAAINSFATREGIQTEENRLSADVIRKLIDRFAPSLGPDWNQQKSSQTTAFKKFKKGVYNVGVHSPAAFIEKNPDKLKSLGLTDSLMRIIAAVSKNEGNLEAVNTWDNAFLTFGMFQWTIGQGKEKGELPALIQKVKIADSLKFEKYFGQYGLDISAPHTTDKVYGYFTLDGQLVSSPEKKELLRNTEWASRFCEAGKDPVVQAAEIEHAASRLWTFYFKPGKAANLHSISDLVTSELGVALILDNHVNRPGYVRDCIDRAMVQTGLTDPLHWKTEDEQKLLAAYLDIRKIHGKYPMTDAEHRGERMLGLQKSGKLSSERGSFLYDAVQSKGLFGKTPAWYKAEDYPEIKWEERGEH